MTKSNVFEQSKNLRKILLASAVFLGSLGITSTLKEQKASASGPDMSNLVTESAKKIVNFYDLNKNDSKIVNARTLANHDTDIQLYLSSKYGSYILSTIVSSTVNVNQNTVSRIQVIADLPGSKTALPKELAFYRLNLKNGRVTEAEADYVNKTDTEFLFVDDKPMSYGIYNQPGLAVIEADEFMGASIPEKGGRGLTLNTDNQQELGDANAIAYTIDYILIDHAEAGLPINSDTIAPPLPLAGNFS